MSAKDTLLGHAKYNGWSNAYPTTHYAPHANLDKVGWDGRVWRISLRFSRSGSVVHAALGLTNIQEADTKAHVIRWADRRGPKDPDKFATVLGWLQEGRVDGVPTVGLDKEPPAPC